MYSIQSLWKTAKHDLPITVIVLDNEGDGVMRSVAKLLKSTRVPRIDLPGLDFVGLARSQGSEGRRVERPADFAGALRDAFGQRRPALLDIRVDPRVDEAY